MEYSLHIIKEFTDLVEILYGKFVVVVIFLILLFLKKPLVVLYTILPIVTSTGDL
jgi:ABC-type siderophore export system fused ATPase/permease subunit